MSIELAVQLLMSIYASGVSHNHTHTLRLRLESYIASQLPSREVYHLDLARPLAADAEEA